MNEDELARINRIVAKNHYMVTWNQNFLRHKYKTTCEAVVQQITKQRGLCALCKCDLDYERKWAIDHDYATGTLRGILCYGCNIGMGTADKRADMEERINVYKRKEWK